MSEPCRHCGYYHNGYQCIGFGSGGTRACGASREETPLPEPEDFDFESAADMLEHGTLREGTPSREAREALLAAVRKADSHGAHVVMAERRLQVFVDNLLTLGVRALGTGRQEEK